MKKALWSIVLILLFSNIWAQDKTSELFKAVKSNETDKVVKILDENKELNINKIFNRQKRTLLHEAAYTNNIKLINILLKMGANPSLKDYSGWSPLHDASFKGHLESVKLLSNTDSIDYENNNEKTPLILAVQKRRIDVIKYLLEKKSDVNHRDKFNWSSLHYASSNGFYDIALLLIRNGAKVNLKNGTGRTALHEASRLGNLKILNLLIESGADVNILDFLQKNPKTALDLAKNDEIKKVLIKNGAKKGKSPFENSFLISPAFKYQHVIENRYALQYGLNINYYISYKVSFYWSFLYGKAGNDFDHDSFHMPGTAMLLHPFLTLFKKNYRSEINNNSGLFTVFMALAVLVPEGISFHVMKIESWLNGYVYFSPNSIEIVDKKNGDKEFYMGPLLGGKLNFTPFNNFVISPNFEYQIMLNDKEGGFRTGINIGYTF